MKTTLDTNVYYYLEKSALNAKRFPELNIIIFQIPKIFLFGKSYVYFPNNFTLIK